MKAKTIIQVRLKVSGEKKEILYDFIKRWSACMRFECKRLLEGKTRNELKKQLQKIFNLNSRYVDDAILEAQNVITLSKELGFNPKKVVFGGKILFEKLSKKHLAEKQRNKLKEKWRERRQGNLYSRGDKSKKGNLKESPQCESGTVSELTDGRNSGTAGKEKPYLYNPWRVLRVAGLTALSPERHKTPRCLSPLKRLLVLGDMGRTHEGREVLLPGAGPMDAQIPPAGAGHPEQRRITNTPAPNCINVQFG